MTPEEHAVIEAAGVWYDASDKEMPAHELAMAYMRYRLAPTAERTDSQGTEICWDCCAVGDHTVHTAEPAERPCDTEQGCHQGNCVCYRAEPPQDERRHGLWQVQPWHEDAVHADPNPEGETP